jgi:hypothetical protein
MTEPKATVTVAFPMSKVHYNLTPEQATELLNWFDNRKISRVYAKDRVIK